MIILAISLVCAPIVVVVFFIFYKLWSVIFEDRKKKVLEDNNAASAISAVKTVETKDDNAVDDEISAVISAAVKIYLKQTN